MALNYDILYELISEDPELLADFGTVREEFDQILTEFLAGAGSVQELDALRRRITAQMEVYTVYADCFQLYEYVLNRMERRFLDLPLSEMTPAELCGVISQGNEKILKTVKGIGLRTAQRIIVDLKDKIAALGMAEELPAQTGQAAVQVDKEVKDEAVGALTMLGFAPAPSAKVVIAILKEQPGLPVEQVVKLALKQIK